MGLSGVIALTVNDSFCPILTVNGSILELLTVDMLLREGPLENLWGRGAGDLQKNIFAQGKIK